VLAPVALSPLRGALCVLPKSVSLLLLTIYIKKKIRTQFPDLVDPSSWPSVQRDRTPARYARAISQNWPENAHVIFASISRIVTFLE